MIHFFFQGSAFLSESESDDFIYPQGAINKQLPLGDKLFVNCPLGNYSAVVTGHSRTVHIHTYVTSCATHKKYGCVLEENTRTKSL